jgi:dipeptidyl-peptidase 4
MPKSRWLIPGLIIATVWMAKGFAMEAEMQLSIERIYADPGLNGTTPARLSFSPDSKRAAFLKGKQEDALQLDLWSYDLATGATRLLVDSRKLEPEAVELSEEEKSRRERQRIRSRGIVEFSWGSDSESILIPLAGDLYHIQLNDAEPHVTQLSNSPEFETDARLSPGGNYASFIRDRALWIVDIKTRVERRISPPAQAAISYGVAEFVAQEEMQRNTGYWWSPDDRFLAYTEIDESQVDVLKRFDIDADGVTVIEQRYPRAGTANAIVKLAVQGVQEGDAHWVDLGTETDIYLARVNWLPDSGSLILQRQSRDQRLLDLIRFDVNSKATQLVVSETAPTYVNLSNDFRGLREGEGFLWTSERSGYRHIEMRGSDGRLIHTVTQGDWPVKSIVQVDEENAEVFFTAHRETPLEQHLYVVNYKNPGEPTRLTAIGMSHSVNVAPDGSVFIATSSSTAQPPQVALYDRKGQRRRWLEENKLDAAHAYFPYLAAHVMPEFGSITTEDGARLYYQLLKPKSIQAGKRYPAIVEVYGGPHAQTVSQGWGNLLDQIYLQRGYIVFRIDGRGSDNRGKAFEEALYQHMGSFEVKDQYAGLDFLKSLDFVDPARIGVRGWSYGGYMSLHLMLQDPDAFAAGVSGAPVTDWLLYDTHYTERYMNLPARNADGYLGSSILPIAGNLKKPLLMIHGMSDDNVIFENSTAVYAYFQANNIPFEMMSYPGQRHGITGNARRAHLANTTLNFFDRHLQGN